MGTRRAGAGDWNGQGKAWKQPKVPCWGPRGPSPAGPGKPHWSDRWARPSVPGNPFTWHNTQETGSEHLGESQGSTREQEGRVGEDL